MNETWPPPPTPEAPWHEAQLRLHDEPGHSAVVTVRVRSVWLWGQEVQINQADEVYCPDCWTFVEVRELGAPDNHHRVGLRPRLGAVFRYQEDEPRRRPPTIWDVQF